MKVFVTGGNGFIGSYVVKALLQKGYQVRCLLRKTSKTQGLNHLNYEIAYGDILDKESIQQGMQGCDSVMHLACLSNWNDIADKSMPTVVITGTQNILETAVTLGNLPVLYFSSTAAIGNSNEPVLLDENHAFNLKGKCFSYAIAKYEAEKLCKQFHQKGLRVVIVNPGEVYGPNDFEKVTSGTLIDFIKQSPVLVTEGGTSLVYVEDVANGAIAALEKGRSSERYILCGDYLTVKQLAELTLSLSHLNRKIISVPNFIVCNLAKIGKIFKLPLPFNPDIIPYAATHWMMDNRKAKTELGVTFRNPTDTLSPTLDWLKQVKMI